MWIVWDMWVLWRVGRVGLAPVALATVLATMVLATVSPRADAASFTCDESGLTNAIYTGGGPHTFTCAGPTTVPLALGTLTPFQPVILDGEDRLSISGDGNFQVFYVSYTSGVELRNLTVTDGIGDAGGILIESSDLTLVNVRVTENASNGSTASGGIYLLSGSLTLLRSEVSNNTGYPDLVSASAIRSLPGSSVTIENSTISGNTGGGYVMSLGGAASVVESTVTGNSALIGGGFSVGSPLGGGFASVAVRRSTISGNTASHAGAAWVQAGSSLEITNSTVSGNNATIARGGFFNFGNLSIASSTVSDNTGAGSTAVTWSVSPASTTFANSIIAGTCAANSGGPVTVVSAGGNLESPGNTCKLTHASDQTSLPGATLGLGTLGDYGGPTLTRRLLPGSPALGAGIGCPLPTTDQRGVPRPQGGGCDAGAWERVVPKVPLLPASSLLTSASLAVAGIAVLRRARMRRPGRVPTS